LFAEQYEREGDLIKFPSDIKYRKEILVGWQDAGLAANHPAKANLYLTEELILHTSEPGDRVADITAGSGSILVGLKHGRDVVAIEIFNEYAAWIIQSYNEAAPRNNKPDGSRPIAFILTGDCQDLLPMPVHSIVFSPPYAGAFNSGGGILSRDKEWMAAVEQYRQDDKNLGNLSNFLYNRAMKKIYGLCFDSLPSGGMLSLIIKDRIEKGVRVPLGQAALRMMGQAGFDFYEWHRWKPPGSMFVSIKKAKGETVILDEHIIIMRKP